MDMEEGRGECRAVIEQRTRVGVDFADRALSRGGQDGELHRADVGDEVAGCDGLRHFFFLAFLAFLLFAGAGAGSGVAIGAGAYTPTSAGLGRVFVSDHWSCALRILSMRASHTPMV